MYSLNWHRSFDICKLLDTRVNTHRRASTRSVWCECLLFLTLVWFDASKRVDARWRSRCERGSLLHKELSAVVTVLPPEDRQGRCCSSPGTTVRASRRLAAELSTYIDDTDPRMSAQHARHVRALTALSQSVHSHRSRTTVTGWTTMLYTVMDLVGGSCWRCVAEPNQNQRSSVLSPFNCSRLLAPHVNNAVL